MSDRTLDFKEALGSAAPREQNIDLMGEEFPEVSQVYPQSTEEWPMPNPQDFEDPAHPRAIPQQQTQSQDESGLNPNDPEVKEILQQLLADRRDKRAAENFLKNHPEYTPSEMSWLMMKDALTQLGLPADHASEAQLEMAWATLNGETPKLPYGAQQAIQQAKAQQPPAKPVQTGLSDRPGDAPLPPVESLQSIAQNIHKLPLEQARLLMQQQMTRERLKNQR